jgi:PAS domain S-box-containing protein
VILAPGSLDWLGARGLIVIFRKISYKNKILLSTLTVVSLLGLGVFLSIYWVLLPNLLSQLTLRGLGIAEGIAESSRSHILTENIPELTSLIFDAAQLEGRRAFISYIFIVDKQQKVLSHTFTSRFPEGLGNANAVLPDQSHTIRKMRVHGSPAYDIAVPIREGIYQIGTVHVGLNKQHIDSLINKMVMAFLVIIGAIIVIGLFMSHFLSKYIRRPISHLTQAADEISRGNFAVKLSLKSEIRCWEIESCGMKGCPAYGNTEVPCWYVDGTFCKTLLAESASEKPDVSRCNVVSSKHVQNGAIKAEDGFGERTVGGISLPRLRPEGEFPEKLKYCKGCIVYAKGTGDEIVQLADSFSNMTHRLRASEAKVRMSEERYRVLFDSTPNSIFVLDPESFRILDVNARTQEIYGWGKEELMKKTFMDLGPYLYAGGVLSTKDREPSIMSSVYQKVQHYRNDGTPFYVNVYARRTKRSHKYGIVAVPVDITESLEKESQLIQAGKLSTLGEMASGVAHEINQPLAAIQIGVDFTML